MPDAAPRHAALDGLRGLAVAAVVVFHFGGLGDAPRPVLAGGWLGVDAFFTLSGYLITSLLLAESARTGGVHLWGFWRRRIRRLQPAALVCIAAIVLSARWWAAPGTGATVRGDALGSVFQVANWRFLLSHRPYAASGQPSAFSHFWSLAVEEQFYVVWPLAIMAAVVIARRLRRDLRVTVFVIACVGTAASWTRLAAGGSYYGTDARVGSILLGAMLACVLPLSVGGESVRPRVRRALSGAGVVAAIAMVSLWMFGGWPPALPLAVVLPAHALLTAVVIAAVVLAPHHGLARAVAVRPLAVLGLVSFGVYLWHVPVLMVATPERLGLTDPWVTVIRIVLIAALTAMSWFLIERPVRFGGRLRLTRLAYPAAVAATIVVAIVTTESVAPSPVWARATGELVRARVPVAAVTTSVPRRASWTRPRRVLVVGDSVPTSLLSTTDATGKSIQFGLGRLLEQFAGHGVDAAAATLTGCPVVEQVPVIPGDVRAYCVTSLQHFVDPAVATFRPDLVVWYSSWEAYPMRGPDGRTHDPMASDAEAASLRHRIGDRVDWFARRHAHVVFVSPGPFGDGHDDREPRHDSVRSMVFLDTQLRMVAAARPDAVVGVIAMSDLTCPQWRVSGHCPDAMFGGGRFRGEDGEHFDRPGAVIAGEWLARRVAALHVPR